MIIPLHPSIPMFGKAFASFGNSTFRPLSLNPIIAYEAESSMVAPFERPTLDLDPSNPSSLDIITATRAGVATYTDADGVVQSASADTVRVDHVDGVPMILVEPAATNGFTHSEGISNFSSLGRSNCSYSVDSNPFGGFSASCKITSSTFTGSYVNAVLQFDSVIGESNYFTFRVKKKSGWFLLCAGANACETSSIKLSLSGEGYISSSGTTANSYTVKEFDDYFLVGIETLQNGTTGAGLLNLRFFNNSSFDNYDLNTVEEFFVTGIQWENNSSFATSYIPTNGSTVTRNADQLVIEGSDFTDFYNQSEGTVYVETVLRSSTTSYLFMLHGGSSANYVRLNNAGQFRVNQANINQVNTSIGSIPLNSLARAAISYKEDDFLGSINGGAEVTDNSGLVPTVNKLHIGSYFTNISYLNGHIKRLIYWPYHSDNL